MALDTSISSVIIEDNVFDYGNFAADTNIFTVPTTYGYGTCIYTTADAIITNNYISGAISGCTPILTIGSISCNISKNTFIRNSVPISCYINASASSGDQIITENIFDNPTVDGTNETIVQLGTPYPGGPLVIYERNKNQTAYKQIQKETYLTSIVTPPSINASEFVKYTDSATVFSTYNVNGNLPFTANYFKQEGATINYSTPFAYTSGVRMDGLFQLTSGSPTVSIIGGVPTVLTNITSSSEQCWIIFGNDNKYYAATFHTGANNSITSITLASNYAGLSTLASFATLFSTAAILQTTLFGNFNVTNGSHTVTATSNQLEALTVGSLMTFNDSSSSIYTVTAIDTAGTNITINPAFLETTGTFGASTGSVVSSFNFSINLSEVLPENVQILSTIFGVYGNNNVDPLIYANYNAFMTTDSGGPYQNNLSGITFTLVNNSPSVTASTIPVGLSVGSSICFSTQSYQVYPVTAISGTSITLGFAYFGVASSSATATYFNNTMADAANYTVTSSTRVGFGNNISLFIGFNGIDKNNSFNLNSQYLKIDPSDPLVSNGFPYFTGSGMLVRYNLNITINMATPGNLFFPESPLIVKYRW